MTQKVLYNVSNNGIFVTLLCTACMGDIILKAQSLGCYLIAIHIWQGCAYSQRQMFFEGAKFKQNILLCPLIN